MKQELDFNKEYEEKFGFKYPEKSVRKTEPGLSEKTIKELSDIKGEKGEHEWIHKFRMRAFMHFMKRPIPKWGGDMSKINFDDFVYYMNPVDKKENSSWEELPSDIKSTFDKLGIPEAERNFLAGVGLQYDSEVVYHKVKEELEKLGVIFVDPDTGLQKYPHIFRKYFGTIIPPEDNKFAALNSAAFSGGSFIYIPKGVEVKMPLQAYFRINAEGLGQFERTLIIADEGSKAHYIEGCFLKGTRVNVRDGVKNIEDIEENDLVLTHNSKYKRVYNVQRRKYSGNIYHINYYGDSTKTISVTEEHPFLVSKKEKIEYSNKKWHISWITASQLKKGDYLAMPIDRELESSDERVFNVKLGNGIHGFKDVQLKIKTDKDFFRLIGYYISEGTTINEHYVTFTFNKNETEYIEDIKSLLSKFFSKEPIIGKEYKNGISITLCSTIAARFFNNNFGHYAKTKYLPQWVLRESLEKQAELIKGYWRGDGSFMYTLYSHGAKRMFRINTISEKLANQIRDILLRLNIFASINAAERLGNRQKMFTICVGGNFVVPFANLVGVYQVININNKYNMLKEISLEQHIVSYAHIVENYAFVPIKHIEEENFENIDVYNFSVEEDESYTACSVAVHNCTAPIYSKDSLHSAVVEIVALPGAHIRYTTLQNWSKNVYNLVTKRAHAYEGAIVEWVDANIGSCLTQKYPSVYLLGKNAKADILSVAFAGKGQHQDTGGKAIHMAPNTTSRITAKSVSKDGGRTSYRGLLHVAKNAHNVKSSVRCDALLLDEMSKTDTYPYNEINNETATITHEASVGKIGEEQLFYLMSRGLNEVEALNLIVMGFFEAFAKEIPLEYAIEFNRLIQLEMAGSVG